MTNLKCSCELCMRISPMIKRISEALVSDQDKKDFEYLITRLYCAENDNEYLNAVHAGQWPGFEWMKEAFKEHGYK